MSTSSKADLSVLTAPAVFPIASRRISNRFVKAAMTERLCTWSEDIQQRGAPTPELHQLYKTWGAAGAGVLLTGNIMVDREHLEAKGNLIVEDERDLNLLREVGAAAKQEGSLFLGQLSHPGRQTPIEIQPHPVSCSDLAFTNSIGYVMGKPRALTQEEIKGIVRKFANTAEVLYKAGWDGVQIHGGHGYLISQFLSPRANHREDKYGGSLQNRARILVEIIDAVREKVTDPTFIVGVKINAADFIDQGFSLEDCQELSKILDNTEKVDFIELSGGTYENDIFETKTKSTRRREAYFLEFAENVRPNLNRTLLCVTGGFRSVQFMVDAINNKSCDLIGIGRPLCEEPFLIKQLLAGEVQTARASALKGQLALLQVIVAGQQIVSLSKGQTPTPFSINNSWWDYFAVQGRIVKLIYETLTWLQVKTLVRKNIWGY